MNPIDLLAAFSWRDALDFTILFVLAYSVLRLMKGTRGAPVLLAVGFFVGAGFVARTLELVAVAALLKYFLEYVILILIVVFNQELRRVLSRIGQRLLPHGRREATQSAISELITAVDRMSKARVGALIVLEGEIDISTVCSDAGRPVEAELRADMLVALSVPHSANLAHDGAILVRDFHIERAAVILPLSEMVLDPRFGTRHRGAIGLSEETDAFVIVLSEERGEIRVVRAGHVSEPISAQELEHHIEAWVDRPAIDDAEPESDLDATVVDKPVVPVDESATGLSVSKLATPDPTDDRPASASQSLAGSVESCVTAHSISQPADGRSVGLAAKSGVIAGGGTPLEGVDAEDGPRVGVGPDEASPAATPGKRRSTDVATHSSDGARRSSSRSGPLQTSTGITGAP